METAIGLAAAFCTTVSYAPQVMKCWRTGEADDLSLRMFLILGAGLSLWVVYGVLRSDWVIVGANTVSVAMLSIIVYFRIRGARSSQTAEKSA